MSLKIAYLINQYPKVSHSFIRREILELERQGVDVYRIAVRGWDGKLVDKEDFSEREKTHYLLKTGFASIFGAMLVALISTPKRFVTALTMAFRMGFRADRPLIYHFVYFAEACLAVRWLKRKGCAHVHAHFGTNPAEVVLLANQLGGLPYSFTVHGPEEFDNPAFLKLGEKIVHSAFVVAISSFGRSQMYRWINHEHWSKVQIVHCGLNSSFYEVPREALPNAPRLVCVGRLCEQKGQLLLIEACRLLSMRNVNFELILAGDGEMRPEIETLIGRYDLANSVRITGWISAEQVRNELLNARGMVLPSFAEGLPVVIMEAMALRRPVLTTYIAGIPELVIHGENGFLFTAGSVEKVANAIEAFLKLPDSDIERMGENAYARVVEYHSIETEVAKLLQLFLSSANSTKQIG